MLQRYREKRNFQKTPEPPPDGALTQTDPFFVVQKHRARRLHYDFRFLHKGALVSWAVPKGPSLDPSDKRLAIRTEDHPVPYADFEGTIPKGEYGAGEVIVWDRGAFHPKKDVEKGLCTGRLHFALEGEKLRGDFEMVRLKDGDKEQWLLIKRTDSFAKNKDKPITETSPLSVKSGKHLEDLKEDASKGTARIPEEIDNAKRASFPKDFLPMLPTLVHSVPSEAGWLHEIKWDGYRLIIRKQGKQVNVITRNGHNWAHRFPDLAKELSEIEDDILLDGEAVILDNKGHSDFQRLQRWIKAGRGGPLHFYAFDLLYLNGFDLRDAPLIERKNLLGQWISGKDLSGIHFSDHIQDSGAAFFKQACATSLEGIISKRANSAYHPGRTRHWLKTKCILREEFLIVGWTNPKGSRKHFGALLLASHDEKRKLVYAGKVGTGFGGGLLEDVAKQLAPLARKTSPLARKGEHDLPGTIHWVSPQLVAEIAYTGTTSDGILRHASFKGLREDKAAEEVVFDRVRIEHPTMPNPGSKPRENVEKEADMTPSKPPKRSRTRSRKIVAGIEITHPDREIDATSRATKQTLAEYYARVAGKMLPWLKDRPLALVRCPQGRHRSCFFQKHFSGTVPNGVRLVDIQEKTKKNPYIYVQDVTGIVALTQYGVIEFHTWGSLYDNPLRPNQIVMDLDPGADVPWEETLGAAFLMRDLLEGIGLKSFPKTTGGKGLHVCVPLIRRTEWETVKPFTRSLAEALTRRNPKRFIATASKAARKGKIYIDYLRNGFGASAVSPYSVRARPNLPISVPLDWDELSPDLPSNHWNILNIQERLDTSRAWSDYFTTRQSLTKQRLAAFA